VIEAFAATARARLQAVLGVRSRVWRIGHASAPLDFPPHAYCSWQNRFDDPRREYRTLYCAQDPLTCLREVLADLRPDTKTRADFEQFQLTQGVAPEEIHHPSQDVTLAWRRENTLAPAVVERNGPLADLVDRDLLEHLATQHAALLDEHNMAQLDISQITSKNRAVSQAISRDLFERGVAGLKFRSNLDAGQCIVLFETRARLQSVGRTVPLTEDHPALLKVCSEYGLVLRAPPVIHTNGSGWRP
jgi:hypothetical protein